MDEQHTRASRKSNPTHLTQSASASPSSARPALLPPPALPAARRCALRSSLCISFCKKARFKAGVKTDGFDG